MDRIALRTRLKAGKEAEYERLHAQIPAELDAMLRKNGVRAWRIYRDGRDLFHYVEVEDYAAFLGATQGDPVNIVWQSRMAEVLDVEHDYGDPQSNVLPMVWELP